MCIAMSPIVPSSLLLAGHSRISKPRRIKAATVSNSTRTSDGDQRILCQARALTPSLGPVETPWAQCSAGTSAGCPGCIGSAATVSLTGRLRFAHLIDIATHATQYVADDQ